VAGVFLNMRQSLRRLNVTAAIVLAAVTLSPMPVDAHLNSTGLGPVYDGALHVLSSPEDLISSLAIALLAGLRGARYGRVALVALPGAWLAGGVAGIMAGHAANHPVAVASFLVVGVLVAMDVRVPLSLLTVMAILLGLVHGFFNGAGMGTLDTGGPALVGLAMVLVALVGLVAAAVIQLRQRWTRIAVRVLGSWIAASGLLMLGWTLHR
jgi:urease accessory protein